MRYTLHPGVAEAGREIGGDGVREAVDAQLAAFWVSVYQHGIETEMEGSGQLVVHAGLSGAPYLLRQGDWERASNLLEHVIARDKSPQTLARVLPRLRRIVTETQGTEQELIDRGRLADALWAAGHLGEAEAIIGEIIDKAEAAGQFRTANAAIGRLINLLNVSLTVRSGGAFV